MIILLQKKRLIESNFYYNQYVPDMCSNTVQKLGLWFGEKIASTFLAKHTSVFQQNCVQNLNLKLLFPKRIKNDGITFLKILIKYEKITFAPNVVFFGSVLSLVIKNQVNEYQRQPKTPNIKYCRATH